MSQLRAHLEYAVPNLIQLSLKERPFAGKVHISAVLYVQGVQEWEDSWSDCRPHALEAVDEAELPQLQGVQWLEVGELSVCLKLQLCQLP